MKTPELDVSGRYLNEYCGCPLCVPSPDVPYEGDKYQIITKDFNNEVVFFRTRKYSDERGVFQEGYNCIAFENEIAQKKFVQDNMSISARDVFRGMHFQDVHPQAKLVNVPSGKVIDFVMDIRPDSSTIGQVYGYYLDSPELFLYIPEGFAHGFRAVVQSIFSYKVSDYRYPNDERCVSLNKTIWPERMVSVKGPTGDFSFTNIWPADWIMNKRDAAAPSLSNYMEAKNDARF